MTKTQQNSSDLATVRDTVESIWVAIVLAFVLRAFFVEAFVIPTGSMAPRLMGEHWNLQCPACQYVYAYGWPGRGDDHPQRNLKVIPDQAQCPTCGYHYADKRTEETAQYVDAGDRVLVMKYLYNFIEPQPWDVIVFKNPQNNRENYIKRLVGLPGESIRIFNGDVFYSSQATGHRMQIRRKPPKAQDSMWQVVHDNDYQPLPDLLPDPPKQWLAQDAGAVQARLFGRTFSYDGSRPVELAFKADARAFLPAYGYNPPPTLSDDARKMEICSDLKLECVFAPKEASSRVELLLSNFERRFRATVSADGSIAVHSSPSLAGDRWEQWGQTAVGALEIGKGYKIALTNVDFRLTLWIDGKAVFESSDDAYNVDFDTLGERLASALEDLKSARINREAIPWPQVKIVVRDGSSELWHLKLMRDVYYTVFELENAPETPIGAYARQLGVKPGRAGWAIQEPLVLAQHPEDPDLDSFFVLGDNSPHSLDGRAWTKAAPTLRLWAEPPSDGKPGKPLYQLGTVPRYSIIGRALFVYWPAGFRAPKFPSVPLIPNVGRMRLIR